jgi:type IX secretion system PorP/SprF family membrane protein
MKKTIILLVIALFVWTGSQAQDVHFSQFNNAPMIINPALTGAFNAEHRIIANYRSQWGTIAKPYTTYALSYDVGLLKGSNTGFLGIGLQLYADKAGDLKMGIIQANLSIAYHLALNKNHFLTAGIQGGYSQRSINGDAMHWDDQYDPYADGGWSQTGASGTGGNDIVGTNLQSFGIGDLSAGMLWTFNSSATNMTKNNSIRGNLGFAVFHINQPKKTFADLLEKKMFIKYAIHTNILIGIPNTNMALVPSGMVFVQGPSREILAGMLFRFRLQEKSKYTNFVSETALSVGAHYRVGDAIVAEAQFEIKNWLIGVSYDVNVSKLSAASKSNGGLEIGLRYQTPIFKQSDKSLY